MYVCIYLFIDFIYFFSGDGEGGKKRGRETSMCERNISWLPLACPQWGTWPATQACALKGNQISNLLVHRPALHPLNHTSQGHGQLLYLKYFYIICDIMHVSVHR